MKPKLLTAAAIAVMTCPLVSLGMGGQITSPQIGVPAGASKKALDDIVNYLNDQVTFVDGSFINEFMHQQYDGSAKKLSRLIELLHNAGFDVQVAFLDLHDDRVAFTLANNTHDGGKVSIGINTTKKGFDLSGLSIRIAPGIRQAEKDTPSPVSPVSRPTTRP